MFLRLISLWKGEVNHIGKKYSYSQIRVCNSELKTLEWDILNPYYLIWESNGMDTLLIFFLNRSFLDIVKKNQKPGFFLI